MLERERDGGSDDETQSFLCLKYTLLSHYFNGEGTMTMLALLLELRKKFVFSLKKIGNKFFFHRVFLKRDISDTSGLTLIKHWGVTNVGSVHWHLKNYPLPKWGVEQLKVKISRVKSLKGHECYKTLKCILVLIGLKRASINMFICSRFGRFPVNSVWITRQQTESNPSYATRLFVI